MALVVPGTLAVYEESDRVCQREVSTTDLGKRRVEWRVLAQCNDETLSVLDTIESGNDGVFRFYLVNDGVQNETVCRGLVLQMAREHLKRLDNSKAMSKAVRVVVDVAKRQPVGVDIGRAGLNLALK